MLKPLFESLRTQSGQSFLVRSLREKAFPAPYHYHPELELTYIVKGEGQRYVGADMSPYTAGDLVMLGPDLPHCWKSERIDPEAINAISVVLQFREDCLGDGFFDRDEMLPVKKLLERSGRGVYFYGAASKEGGQRLCRLETITDPFRRLIAFLELLHWLAASPEYALLNTASAGSSPSVNPSRINRVLAYIVDHFREEISLEYAAGIAGMTSSAFCKFFKKATGKTFVATVTEYRLHYAVQQLVNTDHPVSQISFDSGFGDVSHFYKTFRCQKKMSPLQYRHRLREAIAPLPGEEF